MRVVFAVLWFVLGCSAANPLEIRLDRQVKFWQKRMGLDDWNFTVRVVRQSELDPNSWGAAHWDPDAKTGVIDVLDPRDYNLKGGELRLDMECTIVHELVHIQLSPLYAHSAQEREEVVNRVMAALMNRACPN
ncbi:MAG TPA: hypothetical protein VMB85_19140 [Bryobacteraceae bacterium]|nr:hypothetical protein [Bryobacteraceae bacterium]